MVTSYLSALRQNDKSEIDIQPVLLSCKHAVGEHGRTRCDAMLVLVLTHNTAELYVLVS
jgi:hypothetical protein